MVNTPPPNHCFFFWRENESGRENRFWTFFCIFSRAKWVFHAHFFSLFSLFSRLTCPFSRSLTGFFDIFSRVQKKISRAYFWEFSRVGIMFSRALFEPGNLAATTRLCREACFRYTLESENCVFVWLFVCLFVCLHKWKLNWKWIWVWQKLQPLWLEFYTFHF